MESLPAEDRRVMTSANSRKAWSRMTPEQRRKQVAAAHKAWRGSHHTEESLRKAAENRARHAKSGSAYEAQLVEWLRGRDISFAQQTAIGRYNVDFTIGDVVVEITSGWTCKNEWRTKLAYLFDEGWHLYVARFRANEPLLPVIADDLIAWMKILEASPSKGSQHRVIWRSRQVLSTGSGDADRVAAVLKSNAPLGVWPLYDRSGEQA
jgi:very-short-patch-repair endonuclease